MKIKKLRVRSPKDSNFMSAPIISEIVIKDDLQVTEFIENVHISMGKKNVDTVEFLEDQKLQEHVYRYPPILRINDVETDYIVRSKLHTDAYDDICAIENESVIAKLNILSLTQEDVLDTKYKNSLELLTSTYPRIYSEILNGVMVNKTNEVHDAPFYSSYLKVGASKVSGDVATDTNWLKYDIRIPRGIRLRYSDGIVKSCTADYITTNDYYFLKILYIPYDIFLKYPDITNIETSQIGPSYIITKEKEFLNKIGITSDTDIDYICIKYNLLQYANIRANYPDLLEDIKNDTRLFEEKYIQKYILGIEKKESVSVPQPVYQFEGSGGTAFYLESTKKIYTVAYYNSTLRLTQDKIIDIETGSVTDNPQVFPIRTMIPVSFTINDTAYVIQGNKVYKYNPKSGYISMNNCPVSIRDGIVYYRDGYAYIAGGKDTDPHNRVMKYDHSNDTWESQSAVVINGVAVNFFGGSAVWYENKLHIFATNVIKNLVHVVFDPDTNLWSQYTHGGRMDESAYRPVAFVRYNRYSKKKMIYVFTTYWSFVLDSDPYTVYFKSTGTRYDTGGGLTSVKITPPNVETLESRYVILGGYYDYYGSIKYNKNTFNFDIFSHADPDPNATSITKTVLDLDLLHSSELIFEDININDYVTLTKIDDTVLEYNISDTGIDVDVIQFVLKKDSYISSYGDTSTNLVIEAETTNGNLILLDTTAVTVTEVDSTTLTDEEVT